MGIGSLGHRRDPLSQFVRIFRRLREEEDGHALVGMPGLIGAIGALVLAYGAAEGESAAVWIGGVVLALGVMGTAIARHRGIDYEIYDRLEKLEGKSKE